MDPRGLGLSDRLTDVPTLEERVADLLSVLDATATERATLFGSADTGPACIAAAALHPDRINRLILFGTYAKGSWSEDYPFGWTDDDWERFVASVKEDWGTESSIEEIAPSLAHDEAFRQWFGTLGRLGASPRAVLLLGEMTRAVDVRPLLPQITVPTLVMHRSGDRLNPVEHGRYLADRIPDARWFEMPGEDFALWSGDLDALADEIEEFLTGQRGAAEPSHVVATVMFTDVVGSTDRAVALGDRAWADLLAVHDARIRDELRRFGGREIDTAGDGFLASFSSPTAAINCAEAVIATMQAIGVDVRVGVHTGECEVVGDKLRGITVHIGARVASHAGAGQILVSQTVRDIVAGSGFAFDDQGEHELKGVPNRWRLYRVTNG
jgi:class 3 adenylate cyclase